MLKVASDRFRKTLSLLIIKYCYLINGHLYSFGFINYHLQKTSFYPSTLGKSIPEFKDKTGLHSYVLPGVFFNQQTILLPISHKLLFLNGQLYECFNRIAFFLLHLYSTTVFLISYLLNDICKELLLFPLCRQY